jgi:hypothetical protein
MPVQLIFEDSSFEGEYTKVGVGARACAEPSELAIPPPPLPFPYCTVPVLFGHRPKDATSCIDGLFVFADGVVGERMSFASMTFAGMCSRVVRFC